jgi:hypothetical protein
VKPLRSIVLGFSMIGLSTREGLVSTLNQARLEIPISLLAPPDFLPELGA